MSWYPPKAPRRPGSGPWRAAGKRPFGATWWGKAWVDAIEHRARLDPNRLPRGRTYARTGAVSDLEVHPGEILAAVQGSRAKPYKVTVRVRTYSEKEWAHILSVLASQVGHVAALLDGEMPPAVADDLAGAGIDLLPVTGEVQPRCSCPDWADPCKHSAAVCYLVADTLDADPFLLFLMRGRDRETLFAGLRRRRAAAIEKASGDGGRRPQELAGEAGARGADSRLTGVCERDGGLDARQAWARWAAIPAGAAPPIPAVPMAPAKPGRPTVLAVDPPAGSGISTGSLQRLASDAVQRAWELAHGGRSAGLELSDGEDLARRAAATLGPAGAQGELLELASISGVPARDLLKRALAWRDGGREGLFVLLEEWDPPRSLMTSSRGLLGERARVRRNRVTLADRQLRLGRDGQWYPFRQSGPGARSVAWTPDGGPITAVAGDEG